MAQAIDKALITGNAQNAIRSWQLAGDLREIYRQRCFQAAVISRAFIDVIPSST